MMKGALGTAVDQRSKSRTFRARYMAVRLEMIAMQISFDDFRNLTQFIEEIP